MEHETLYAIALTNEGIQRVIWHLIEANGGVDVEDHVVERAVSALEATAASKLVGSRIMEPVITAGKVSVPSELFHIFPALSWTPETDDGIDSSS